MKQHEKLPFRFKPDIPKHLNIRSILAKAESLAESFDYVYCIIDLDRILLNQRAEMISKCDVHKLINVLKS